MLLPLLLASLVQDAHGHPHPHPHPQGAPAGKATEPPKLPANLRFKVTPDTIVKLGSVGPKEVKTVDYEITNTSDKPITFRVIDMAPGTTATPEAFQKPFQPGESRKFTVTVDPTGFSGFQKRAVKLEPDDLKQPRFITRIELVIRPEMSVDQVKKSLGEVAPHESPQAVYTFKREGGDLAQIRLSEDTKLPPYLEAEVANEGLQAELRLTLRPKLLKPGQQAGLELLKVETNAPREPKFSLTLDWRLRLPVVPDPPRILFENDDQARQPLVLTARDGKPFKILGARIEGDGFALGIFPKGVRPTSGQIGDLPNYPAPSFTLPLWLAAKAESRATLMLSVEGMDDPLRIPLSYLPPAPGPAPAEKAPESPEPGR